MPFEYKCPSCQATGDLDSFVNQIECPNCGGMMAPVTAPPAPVSPDGIDDGETSSTIVPNGEVLKETATPKRVVKVAKIVDIGFGGMLTTSATRGFKPITPGRKDAGFPFSQQLTFSQQSQRETHGLENETTPEHDEPLVRKQFASSSSTSLGSQRKKTFTMSKSKPTEHSLQQTSTHHMAATQIDSRIAATVPHQKRAVPPVTSVQAPQEALQNRRPSGPTSAPLKFLPKGALKVAQTHTSIQRSQIPPPPPKLQAQSENPFQTQQQMPRQYEQQSSNSDQDENFEAQVRIEAERQEAILREAYRIAEGKIRKEREEAENKSAVNTGYAAKEAAKTLVAQIAEELAATEELISKEREILELRKKELREIRESAEKETGSAKSQENKIILLPPQKPVKLKSGEGSEILMRSSKNLQIDKKMLQTGRLVLNKKELEKKDSKPELTTETEKDLEREKSTGSGIVKIQVKGKTSTKIGINTATPVTNITLVKIQKKKKTIILFIVGLAVAVACILIFFIGGAIARKFKSSFSTSPVAAPPALTQDKLPASVQSGKKTGSPLQMEYNELYQKIRKMPANRQEVDNNIREWQDFIDSHPNATDTDKCIKDAKAHIKDMQNMKELY